jgi:hypothetical protein
MKTPKTFILGLTGLLALACWIEQTPAADPPQWQPMLAKSFKGDVKDVRVTSLVVYRNPGCVFLLVEGKVYCSPPGATRFKPVSETWKEVCAQAEEKSKGSKHLFAVSDGGIKESTDGGATWSAPIAPPKDFVINSQTWVGYDATNDVLYLMKAGSDLYKLPRKTARAVER